MGHKMGHSGIHNDEEMNPCQTVLKGKAILSDAVPIHFPAHDASFRRKQDSGWSSGLAAQGCEGFGDLAAFGFDQIH